MPADADAKTEPATPRRRREARNNGQVAKSQDLTSAILLFTGFLALKFLGPRLWQSLLDILRTALMPDAPASKADLPGLVGAMVIEITKRLGPFLLILFMAILLILRIQVGRLYTLKTLKPDFAKLNPINGMKRFFSTRVIVMAFINFGKLLIVSWIIYLAFAQHADAIVYAFTPEFGSAFWLGSGLAFDLGMRLSAALLILALLDLAWQRHKYEKDLRMTKEEVKDELRSMEGDPKIKLRRRKIQYQLALQRIRQAVPGADVVVTNPTHVAVAIKYDAETMAAPKVVAKGADELALRIRQIAEEFGIPIVERKILARAMFESVEVGEYLPERFYRAIAEILAYVYELTGRSPVGTRGDLIGAR
ncbi:MAG: flagellar biosynthesis protein FlhB [Planctomycetota bacterium]|jgi:flagellar biosynthetic protein FlhB